MLTILAQAQKAAEPSVAHSIGELILYGWLAFVLIALVVSTRCVMECVRKGYASPAIVSTVLYGLCLAPLILAGLVMYDIVGPIKWFGIYLLGSSAAWVVAVVIYTIHSMPQRRAEVEAERARGQQAFEPAPAFSAADVVEEIDAGSAPAPRRVVTIPAADSDEGPGRASQQTLKRMSMEEVEQSSAKGPRAGELPENPILPDEVVKIRCLACDKKMQAEGPKFAKQRRCPNCKAAPFRYVTAV
jgi:hypothetical protein